MEKKGFVNVGDRISTRKYGRWTVVEITEDGFIVLVKIRKGKITEIFKVRNDKLFS
jgi:RNA-binding protein YlmH